MEGASNELMASNPPERILWAASAGQDADYCHDDHKKQNVQNQETNLNADCSRTLYARNSTHDNEGYVYVQPNTGTETESEAPHQGHQEGTQPQDEESKDVTIALPIPLLPPTTIIVFIVLFKIQLKGDL